MTDVEGFDIVNVKEIKVRGIPMWRTASLLFVVLTTAIGGMLSLQWKAYSKQGSQLEIKSETVEQELTVQSSEKDLHISQRLVGLTKGKEYKVTIPNELFQWTCIKENGDSCESNDEDPQTFLPDESTIIFQYTLPIQNENTPFFLSEWTTNVLEVVVKKTDIEIIDTFRRQGTWIAGAPLKGLKEMDLIDYYLFSGIGAAPSLYWQPTTLHKIQMNNITYYSEQSVEKNRFQFEEIANLKGFPYLSVVLTDQFAQKSGNGLLIASPTIKDGDLKWKLIYDSYESKFKDNSKEDKWLLDVFTSYTANQESGSEKSKTILEELNKMLSDEEMTHLFNRVNNKTSKITTEELDGFIFDLKGRHTRFFTLNSNESAQYIPFYYYDLRRLIINEKEQKDDIEAIYKENKILFPFIETIKGLGFEVTMLPDQEAILVIKDKNRYRFYLNRNIFIYNEEDYGLLENPLTRLNGKYYISNEWLRQLFKVSIEEGEEDIRISL